MMTMTMTIWWWWWWRRWSESIVCVSAKRRGHSFATWSPRSWSTWISRCSLWLAETAQQQPRNWPITSSIVSRPGKGTGWGGTEADGCQWFSWKKRWSVMLSLVLSSVLTQTSASVYLFKSHRSIDQQTSCCHWLAVISPRYKITHDVINIVIVVK